MKIEDKILMKVEDGDIKKDGSFVVPKNIDTVENFAFRDCSTVKNVKIGSNVSEIGVRVFDRCINLESVVFDTKTKVIPSGTFANCRKLSSVTLPKNLYSIRREAFLNCSNLKLISLPSSTHVIAAGAFAGCSSLKKVKLSPSISVLEDSVFRNCFSLDDIKLPKGLEEISDSVFMNCDSLKNITLPSKLKYIKNNAFWGCKSLEKIEVPNSVKVLGSCTFADCANLKSAIIDAPLRILKDRVFENDISLSKVVLPDSLEEIGSRGFFNCKSLKTMTLPQNVTTIGNSAFEKCSSLAYFNGGNSLEAIGTGAFRDCESLEFAKLGNSVELIFDGAFENCKKLKDIEIGPSVKEIGDNVFKGCDSLENISLPIAIRKIGSLEGTQFKYFTIGKNLGRFELSKENLGNSIPIESIKINYAYFANFWKYKDKLFSEQKNEKIADFYNKFFVDVPFLESSRFMDSHNFTFFKKLDIDIAKDNYSFYNLLYSMGAFSMPVEVNGKKVDYAQKIGEFFIEKMRRGEFDPEVLGGSFTHLTYTENLVKPEFVEFFMKNFDEIMAVEKEDSGFIYKCFTHFDEVQATNTSNRGSQRQLKPTVKKFLEYFRIGKFKDVTEDTKEIAFAIAPYFSDQMTFEDAVHIDRERINAHTPNSILSTHLRGEKADEFIAIDKMSRDINAMKGEILSNLCQVANVEFAFDWLEKNDPQNFILGKLCSCCAHLEGVGNGIMKASIVLPNVQNLVIRNSKGKIVAKSTLYVNVEEGYGVFNNVEVDENVDETYKHKIYSEYMLGVRKFAEEYNKEHPDKPLKQINVGMHLNDLENEISEYNYKADDLLEAIDYSKYSNSVLGYSGDSDMEQYIIWRADEKTLLLPPAPAEKGEE